MFSRDEMQRAIEDALRQMEGVALELYRRGREEAREELETVKRERDEARADAQRWRESREERNDEANNIQRALNRAARERDEARAEVERLKAISRDEVRGMTLEQVSDLVVAESLWTRGYRRGAEAMREACAEACWSVPPDAHPSDCAFAVNAMPIPEET